MGKSLESRTLEDQGVDEINGDVIWSKMAWHRSESGLIY
jgi:hypothetical protein